MATEAYSIIRQAPPPTRRSGGGKQTSYPFRDMEVGDAFDVPRDGERTKARTDRVQSRVSNSIGYFVKRHAPDRKYTTRLLDEHTVRVWRVA